MKRAGTVASDPLHVHAVDLTERTARGCIQTVPGSERLAILANVREDPCNAVKFSQWQPCRRLACTLSARSPRQNLSSRATLRRGPRPFAQLNNASWAGVS